MADKKLSALTDADTPLAGDELIYVVQDGNSRKVATGSLYIPGGTDVAVSDGGTGASNASDARDNLGLTIGADVQAYSATLDAIAQVSPESYGLGLLEMPDAASAQVYLDLAPVAASGDYDDLDNKPTLGTMAAEDASNYTPTSGLAAVALSNDYTDLDNLPSLAPIATSGDFDDLTNVPTNVADLADLTPGTDGQVVGWQSGELATFTASGSGDMLASMYDPNGVEADAFDSANHAYDNTGSGLSATNVQDAIDKIASVANSAVLFEAQTLNATQKAQARANITALSYESQSLSSAQRAQARANINAPERIVLDVVAPAGAGVGGAVPLTLSDSKAYTIRLNTLSTGTKTGAVYNLWYDGSAWNLKRLAGISGSNQPELRLNSNGDGLEVFTQHQNDYTIRLHIDVWDTNNPQGIAESFFDPAVSYVPQTLSPAEKGQARANIDALGPNETADRAFRRGNILGTVSQSGGTPTGAIIERGSNANGEYVRFADGTQICWMNVVLVTNIAVGQIFGSDLTAVTFPAAFAAIPSVNVAPRGSPRWGGVTSNITSSVCEVQAFSATSSPSSTSTYVVAIGRWL